jgi:hypothetical protein
MGTGGPNISTHNTLHDIETNTRKTTTNINRLYQQQHLVNEEQQKTNYRQTIINITGIGLSLFSTGIAIYYLISE